MDATTHPPIYKKSCDQFAAANQVKAQSSPKYYLSHEQLDATPPKYELSCEQFAAINQVVAQSVRARICRTGSYYGIRPVKLANSRLLFPDVVVSGDEHHAVAAADRVALKAARDAKQEALDAEAAANLIDGEAADSAVAMEPVLESGIAAIQAGT